jgi:multiple sugar transport system permease protein
VPPSTRRTSNGIVTVGLLTFMISWGEFIYAVNFLNNPSSYPAPALLTTYLGQYHSDWPGLFSASVATSLPVIAIFLVFQRRLSSGLSAGAVKG